MSKNQLKNDITIKEMYATKQQLEAQLFQAVKKFEDMSGCLIVDINFRFKSGDEDLLLDDTEGKETESIELDVRLNNDFYGDLNKE